MTFLSPWTGLVGAAIAVPALIALYLLKLRRKPVRVSSTLLWEQAAADLQANVPLRWLRASYLLLLQLLALGALLAALARPAIPSALGTDAERAVIIIDASASMSALDGVPPGAASASDGGSSRPISRLDEAKQHARLLVEGMRRSGAGSRRTECMVVSLANEARVAAPFSSDPRTLLDAIDAIEPTDQPGRLEAALELTGAMSIGLDAEPDGAPRSRTRVVLISDGSFETSRLSGGLPSGMRFSLIPVGSRASAPTGSASDAATDGDQRPAERFNLGIVALAARRDADDPATVRVFARVINSGDRPASALLSCRVDNEPVGARTLEIPASTRAGAEPDGIAGALEPGEAGVSFDFARSGAGVVTVAIVGDDLLASDNVAACVLRAARKPVVLVVGPGDDPSDEYRQARGERGVDRFLLGALRELDLGGLRVLDARAYEALAMSAASGEPAIPGDLVIFDRVTPSAPPSRPTLSFGAGIGGDDGVTVSMFEPTDAAAAPTRIVSWRRTHPLLRHAPLDSVLVSPPMRMSWNEQWSPGGAPRATITPLAQGVSGTLIAGIEGPGPTSVSPRRVVVGFDLLRTNWGPDVSFPVFVATAVEWLTGRGDAAAGVSYTTAEPIALLPVTGQRTITLSGPASLSVGVPDRDGGASGAVSVGVLSRVGVYAASGTVTDDAAVAVNLVDARESVLDVRSSIRLGESDAVISSGQDPGRTKPVREIWHWFVLIGAGLLTVEWLLFAWKLRS